MHPSTSIKTAAFWLAAALILGGLWWVLAAALVPFLVAFVLAYALLPAVDALERRFGAVCPRPLAVVLVELFFLTVVLAVALLMVPIVATEIPLIQTQLPLMLARASDALGPWVSQLGLPVSLDREGIQAMAKTWLAGHVAQGWLPVLESVREGSGYVVGLAGNAVLVPVALFYLLLDWHAIIGRVQALVPLAWQPAVVRFVDDTNSVLGQYLRGQLLVMVLLAAYYSVALRLFGLDLAVPIGVFTGMAIFVPYLGFGLGLVLATLAGVLQFSATGVVSHAWLMVAIVFGTGQLLEGFVLTPRLVGERIGLHPLAVIFALLAFGQIFGLVGVLVALPVSAVLLVALRRLRVVYLASPFFKNQA